MSSNTPFGPEGTGGPEYLGQGSPERDEPNGSGRRWSVLGATAAGVVAVVGLGGWGAYALLSGGGDQPADALPADTVGYVSLDLDPSAAQKVEAFQMFRKFPALREELGVDSADDVRRLIFEEIQNEGTCKDLDYDRDVEPWIGQRVAVAVVPDSADTEGPDAPVFALQVSDQQAAEQGIEALAACGGADDEFGFAFSGDYALLTDSTKRAEALAAEAAEGSLADDASFQEWTDQVGDPGILTMYAAPEAPRYFAQLQEDLTGGAWTDYDAEGADGDAAAQKLAEEYKNFRGMAGTVRFDDGAVEAEFASAGLPDAFSADGGSAPSLATLPDSTGFALTFALSDGWLDTALESLSATGGVPVEDLLAAGEAQTGLQLPEDIETLLGDGVSVSVDADADYVGLFESEDITGIPLGLRVTGDPSQILPIVDKIKSAVGPDADLVTVQAGDGMVAFGLKPEYVASLLEDGSLGDTESFDRVLPEADRANGALYLSFDAGDGWAEQLARTLAGPDSDEAANVAPLDALGLSTWTDGDVQRARFVLTTD